MYASRETVDGIRAANSLSAFLPAKLQSRIDP
jgi:hypothetical protein